MGESIGIAGESARARHGRDPRRDREIGSGQSAALGLRQPLAHGGDDCILAGKVAAFLRYDLAVDLDDERSRRADLQVRLDAQLLLQRSRRTGGPGLVPSGVAVFDLDHAAKIAVPAPARQRRTAADRSNRSARCDIRGGSRESRIHGPAAAMFVR